MKESESESSIFNADNEVEEGRLMNDAMKESKNEPSIVNADNEVEEDKCDKLISKNEKCQFEYGKAVCKCIEEFKRNQAEENTDNVLLPSAVIEQEYIFFPNNITAEDPTIYGKWLIFTNGNLRLQDHLWIQLQNLLKSKDLVLLESSTAKMCDNRGPFQGVIKCYTSKDIYVIRQAGIAIQNILNDQTILDYKTNEASRNNLYRARGNRFITKFMLTANGKLYKKDMLCRWIQISDAEYLNFKFDEHFSEVCLNQGSPPSKRKQYESGVLPSRETNKKIRRYVYPDGAHFMELSGIWCLFCNITDVDNSGLTELDRTWNQAKILCDQKIFQSVICETYACKSKKSKGRLSRTVMCEVHDLSIDKVIECGDTLRERLSYNMLMYFKINLFDRVGKPEYRLKYLYTEDRDLYEYTEDKWKLLQRD